MNPIEEVRQMTKQIKYKTVYHVYTGDKQNVNGTPSSRDYMLLEEGNIWERRMKSIFKVDLTWASAFR